MKERMIDPTGEITYQPTIQSVNQPINNKQTHQPINQSTNKQTYQPFNQPTINNQLTIQQINKPVNQQTDQPSQPANKEVIRPTKNN